ncbi:hypothetical protein SAMN02927924_02537 [Sphingobium faniae]|nr:hypothetical protein SAMN02927924_02537 [Sphingobium faniae]
MSRAVYVALMTLAAPLALAAPAQAQEAPAAPAAEASPAATAAPAEAAPAAGQMTQEQIAAFNQAVTDFTAGQQAQQAGDNAGAATKYEAALPAIRTAVQAQPDNVDNVNFLANALYADAAAQGAQGQMDKVIALYGESLPHWRKVVEAKPTDAASRNILAGILIQLGNQKLAAKDMTGADPYYKEAVALARKSVAENAADKVNRNILLSALIGASQTANDEALRKEALDMGKSMMADGSIDAVNKPSIEVMTGQAS